MTVEDRGTYTFTEESVLPVYTIFCIILKTRWYFYLIWQNECPVILFLTFISFCIMTLLINVLITRMKLMKILNFCWFCNPRSVLLYLQSTKGGCCSISDDLSCSLNLSWTPSTSSIWLYDHLEERYSYLVCAGLSTSSTQFPLCIALWLTRWSEVDDRPCQNTASDNEV